MCLTSEYADTAEDVIIHRSLPGLVLVLTIPEQVHPTTGMSELLKSRCEQWFGVLGEGP